MTHEIDAELDDLIAHMGVTEPRRAITILRDQVRALRAPASSFSGIADGVPYLKCGVVNPDSRETISGCIDAAGHDGDHRNAYERWPRFATTRLAESAAVHNLVSEASAKMQVQALRQAWEEACAARDGFAALARQSAIDCNERDAEIVRLEDELKAVREELARVRAEYVVEGG